jgi:hypothetical protein
MLPAVRTKFLHFETLSGRLLVLGARIVPVLAFLTLERDNFSRHFLTSFDGHAATSRVLFRAR